MITPPPTPKSALTKPETSPIATRRNVSGLLEAELGIDLHRQRERLGREAIRERQQVLVRDPEADPVGHLEARLFPEHLDRTHEVVDACHEPQLIAQCRV